MAYKIGEFSKLSGLTIDTLRYYEKEGLLRPERSSSDRRQYSDDDLAWTEFLKRLKLTGMSIKKMKIYAELRYQGAETVRERLLLLEDQLAILLHQRQEIDEHIDFLHQKMTMYSKMLTGE